MTVRYAIYLMPEPNSALWRFGSSVIGYDAASKRVVDHPRHPAFQEPKALRATEAPRRYGFHGTLKAPFALADGTTEAGLVEHARAFANARTRQPGPVLEVAMVDEFVALVSEGDAAGQIDTLAADCVREFDPFRGPISEADLLRRLAAPLTPRERAHLDRWGYPYVFEDFRFHMSLTGALAHDVRDELLRALQELYVPVRTRLDIDAIAIFKQPDRSSRFHVLERMRFRE